MGSWKFFKSHKLLGPRSLLEKDIVLKTLGITVFFTYYYNFYCCSHREEGDIARKRKVRSRQLWHAHSVTLALLRAANHSCSAS